MLRFVFLLVVLFLPLTSFSAPHYRNLIRCQISEGYEIAVQKNGKAYFVALIYGDKTEYRERLTKPKRMSISKDRNKFVFELKKPGTEDYIVKISTQFDEDAASYDEFVHFKMLPRPKRVASYKLYEMAGNGLPITDLGCFKL